jgi:uncharacterized protein
MFTNEIIGGALIGLASVTPLFWEGRVAGVSGYAANSLRPKSKDFKSSIMFVLGLVLGGVAWRLAGLPLPVTPTEPLYSWGLAGLLVGFGSRLGGGCTSGHGVCGLGRLSKRSLVAVITFMSIAIITRVILGSST